MSWIVIYTKPRQEMRAKENLENLNLNVSFPMRPVEKVTKGVVDIRMEPLFPRYIFIRYDPGVFQRVSHTFRSLRGVSQIVKFGGKFAELDDKTFEEILRFEKTISSKPIRAYEAGERVIFTHNSFRNISALYQELDGDKRVILLFDLLNNPVRMSVPLAAVKTF
jgi:transcriptional antiterminator RfaH